MKKAKPKDEAASADAEKRIAALAKKVRELAGEAADIENAVYDLKAVNPNAQTEEDTCTPEEILDLIDAKGRDIAEALAVLREVPRQSVAGKEAD